MNDSVLIQEYRARINRVEDYIQQNLEAEMSLEELANVAAFSKYHFGRIFAMMTGETLFQYIQRMRVEKAASLLLSNPDRNITDTALSCGFSGSQAFSRSFNKRFGVSATRWRKLRGRTPEILQRIDAQKTRIRQSGLRPDTVVQPEETDVVKVDDIEVIYLRYVGPFQGDTNLFAGLFGTLNRWAAARSIIGPETRFFSIVHDNPSITDDRKIRISCCLSVPEAVEPEGEIGRMKIKGGRYARGQFTIDDRQYGQAWGYMFGIWLPSSGYQPDEQPCFEEYFHDSADSSGLKHTVSLWIPVRPLPGTLPPDINRR